MKLISENLHIISKSIREALVNRDEMFIENLLKEQISTFPDAIDLNIGPAKKNMAGTMRWLTHIASDLTDIPLSFDSTNIEEVKDGLRSVKNTERYFINSASAEQERLETFTDVAAEYKSNLIALTLNNTIGIPKTADGRMELAFTIYEKALEKGIESSKIYFDPLILPIGVEQSQAKEALDSIRMFKESFEPGVMTVVGLSNISNGAPKDFRPLINQVYFILAAACGLDAAIVDSFDFEIIRINELLTSKKLHDEDDKLILDIYEVMQNFGELEDVNYDKNNKKQSSIYKTAEVLLNKNIFSNNYLATTSDKL